MTGAGETPARRAQLVTLGCARNDTDSEELAARLEAGGWTVLDDTPPASAPPDVILVNTCGFIASAKKDSVDTLLAAADTGARVVAVGCLAERYGAELADELPEAAAVLGFDRYPTLPADLDRLMAGETLASHAPADRRRLLPMVPSDRQGTVIPPGHGDAGHGDAGHGDAGHGDAVPHGSGNAGPPESGEAPGVDLGSVVTAMDGEPASVPVPGGSRVLRRRLNREVVAPLKIASGCDRRCAFCAIPSFRGSFVSRPPADILAEARWLAADGVREIVLVSENSTSYGKDLGDLAALERLLPALAAVPGIARVRVVYLQPAEVRPGLVHVLTSTPGVAAYADLSFQHASPTILRRMRRFGGTDRFLELLAAFRAGAPELGARTNVIVGFPGETEGDVEELERFLGAARLDAIGVFGYSDEDGTEAAGLEGALPQEVIDTRVARIAFLAEQLTAQRAEERVGETVEVLVEGFAGSGRRRRAVGRAAHQQPEVDGGCTVRLGDLDGAGRPGSDLDGAGRPGSDPDGAGRPGSGTVAVGDVVTARVIATDGVDLVCEALAPAVVGEWRPGAAAPALSAARP